MPLTTYTATDFATETELSPPDAVWSVTTPEGSTLHSTYADAERSYKQLVISRNMRDINIIEYRKDEACEVVKNSPAVCETCDQLLPLF